MSPRPPRSTLLPYTTLFRSISLRPSLSQPPNPALNPAPTHPCSQPQLCPSHAPAPILTLALSQPLLPSFTAWPREMSLVEGPLPVLEMSASQLLKPFLRERHVAPRSQDSLPEIRHRASMTPQTPRIRILYLTALSPPTPTRRSHTTRQVIL